MDRGWTLEGVCFVGCWIRRIRRCPLALHPQQLKPLQDQYMNESHFSSPLEYVSLFCVVFWLFPPTNQSSRYEPRETKRSLQAACVLEKSLVETSAVHVLSMWSSSSHLRLQTSASPLSRVSTGFARSTSSSSSLARGILTKKELFSRFPFCLLAQHDPRLSQKVLRIESG